MENQRSGLSRRDFLKRGAILGGAVVWATPIVQVVGMRPALAQTTSPVCDQIYAIKINNGACDNGGTDGTPIGGEAYCCEDITNQSPGPGKCITTPAVTAGDPCDKIASVEYVTGAIWHIRFVEGCQYVDGAVGLKSGGGSECTNEFTMTPDPDGMGLTFEHTGVNSSNEVQAISHVEFVFCCDH